MLIGTMQTAKFHLIHFLLGIFSFFRPVMALTLPIGFLPLIVDH